VGGHHERGLLDGKAAVRSFIVENFLFGDGDRLADTTSLMEEGIIDSTGLLELIMFLEETFGSASPTTS